MAYIGAGEQVNDPASSQLHGQTLLELSGTRSEMGAEGHGRTGVPAVLPTVSLGTQDGGSDHSPLGQLPGLSLFTILELSLKGKHWFSKHWCKVQIYPVFSQENVSSLLFLLSVSRYIISHLLDTFGSDDYIDRNVFVPAALLQQSKRALK